MRKRTLSRQLAMQYLYQVDLLGTERAEPMNQFLQEFSSSSEVFAYTKEIVDGCLSQWNELNAQISAVAQNWDLSRMAVIDRTILRIAIWELFHREVPHTVVINEAIELGKRFSTGQSGAFINGILDKIKNTILVNAG